MIISFYTCKEWTRNHSSSMGYLIQNYSKLINGLVSLQLSFVYSLHVKSTYAWQSKLILLEEISRELKQVYIKWCWVCKASLRSQNAAHWVTVYITLVDDTIIVSNFCWWLSRPSCAIKDHSSHTEIFVTHACKANIIHAA